MLLHLEPKLVRNLTERRNDTIKFKMYFEDLEH